MLVCCQGRAVLPTFLPGLRSSQSLHRRRRALRRRRAGAQQAGNVDDGGRSVFPADDGAVRLIAAYLHDYRRSTQEERCPAGIGRGRNEHLAGQEALALVGMVQHAHFSPRCAGRYGDACQPIALSGCMRAVAGTARSLAARRPTAPGLQLAAFARYEYVGRAFG